MQPQSSTSYQVATPVREYGGVGRRFFAFLIDGIILGVFRNLLFFGIDAMGLHASANATTTQGDAYDMFKYWLTHLDVYGVLQIVVIAIIPLVYFIIMEALQGATIGKMVLGIRVVRLDGSPISWSQSISRNLLRLIDQIPYGIPYLLGAILIWTSSTRQRLGDRFADTVVVYSRR